MKKLWSVISVIVTIVALVICGMAIFRIGYVTGAKTMLQQISSTIDGNPTGIMSFYSTGPINGVTDCLMDFVNTLG